MGLKNAGQPKAAGGKFGLPPWRSDCPSREYSDVAKREGGGWNWLFEYLQI